MLCGECIDGYAWTGGSCELCDGDGVRATRVLAGVVLIVVLCAYALTRLPQVRAKFEGKLPKSELLEWLSHVNMGTLRMMWSNFSILSMVPETLNVEFPDPAKVFYRA